MATQNAEHISEKSTCRIGYIFPTKKQQQDQIMMNKKYQLTFSNNMWERVEHVGIFEIWEKQNLSILFIWHNVF